MSLRSTGFISFAIVFLSLLITADVARGQFDELARRVPDSANILVLFNADKVYDSPLGKQKDWRGKHSEAFVSGLVTMPPDTSHFVLASQLDFEFVTSQWDVALLDLNKPRLLADVARKFGGSLDQVADLQGVALPSDTYIVRFTDTSFGAMAPANRQAVGRWVRDLEGRQGPALSPYLTEALGFVENVGTPVIMAIDLQDVVTPASVVNRLGDSPTVTKQKADLNQLAPSLASIRGVTLGITFNQSVFGKIKIDFASDVSNLGEIAKPLFLEILGNNGCMIEDFESWTVAAKGNQITLQGTLTDSGLRRIFSLMDAPLAVAHATAEQEPGAQAADAKAQSSKQYFASVSSLLDDLSDKKGTASHLNLYGVWFEKYAQKVAQLPMLNVDEELLNYGQYIEEQLRNASLAVKNKGIRTRAREVDAVANLPGSNAQAAAYEGVGYAYGGGYRYGRYGAYGATGGYYQNTGAALNQGLREQQSARTQIQSQEKASMATNVIGIVDEIKAATSTVRRNMTQKYQIEF